MPWSYVVTALAVPPDELGSTGIAMVARTRRPLMRIGNPDRSSASQRGRFMGLDPDTPGPAGFDGTTVGKV